MMFQTFARLFVVLLISVLSYGVDREDVTYFLFNKEYYNVQIDQETLDYVDSSLPIVFLIHGWVADSNDSWVSDLTDVYLNQGNYNVITVDWSGPAGDFYPSTVQDVKYIGQYFGEILNELYVNYSVNPSTFHLIGHSLGAQISGLAGATLQNLSGISIGRITGLDPALPLFSLADEEDRLSKDDADLVVVIHTDGGVAGFMDPVGDIDFFPNGGKPPQPGCIEITTSCSHVRATEYFVEAIGNPSGFVSKKCNSYLLYQLGLCRKKRTLSIGGSLSIKDAGLFYLKTNSDKPYSKE